MADNKQQQYPESKPGFRSVQIGGQSATSLPQPISIAPRVLQKQAPAHAAPKPRSSDYTAWNVKAAQALPSFYKLERSHIVIHDVSPVEVASRIADCLRKESVRATFHDEEAMVEAETHECVRFTTQLFTNAQGKLIVEVQRQSGCCFLFHQSAKAVLRAAKGMEPAKRRTLSIPPNLPKCPQDEERECLEQGVELAAAMLKKDRIDAHLLAMESLSHLSKSTKCGCLVAKTILCGPLLETIVSLIECGAVCPDDLRNEEKVGEIQEQYGAEMHRLAITVFADCLTSVESVGEMDTVLQERREQMLSPNLLSALVNELRRAEQRPHDACEAARCLQPLVRSCPDCKPRLLEFDAINAAAIALDAGACTHANLEKESLRLKQEIANCT